MNQHTLAKQVTFEGIGIHSGAKVTAILHPAPLNHGLVFHRSDVEDKAKSLIKATPTAISEAVMCTKVTNPQGISVSTVEHLMAALWDCGIDNALIELNSPEVPIMDGSAKLFIQGINKVGIVEQDRARTYIKVIKPIKIEIEDKYIELLPNEESQGIIINMTIDFPHQAIGNQSGSFDEIRADGSQNSFLQQIGMARTFGFLRDLEALQASGLAKGASLENAIGLDSTSILNPEGLRYKDEFVRHKILDCLGDMYMNGSRLITKIIAYKSGHAMHNKALRALFENPNNYLEYYK